MTTLTSHFDMKRCFRCGVEKPITDFYRHPAMADGYLGKCKECAKTDVQAHHQQNLERVRQYDRQRGWTEARKIKNQKAHEKRISTEEGRKRELEYRQKWLERNRIKRACHILVGNAIRAGKLIAQPCERCGAPAHAHHEDYSKPFEITWLCPKCHGFRHREINEVIRTAVPIS